MKKNLKTILILIICGVISLSVSSSCFSGGSGSDLIIADRSSSSEDIDEDEDTIDSKLSLLRSRIVTAPIILSHVSGEVIYSSGDKELVFIKGLAEAGDTIDVYVNGELQQSGVIVDNNGSFETINGVEITEGNNTIEMVAVNPAGNESNPTIFYLFLEVPQKVEYFLFENSTDLREIESIYYSTETNPVIYIQGKHLSGSQVYIQVNDKIVGEVECEESGIFDLENVTLKLDSNEIAVWAETADGFMSAPVFKDVMVFKDLAVPYPSDLTGYKQGSANYLSWTQSSDSNFNSYKLVKMEDPCLSPDLESDDVIATFGSIADSSYVDEDIEEDKSYYYSVWTIDAGGRMVSSNVLAIPSPDYTISIAKVPPFSDVSKGRRERFIQYYEITNLGTVTLNLQPMRVWEKLSPDPDPDMELAPLWEVHIWNPEEADTYYYSYETIDQSYISDWANTGGTVETETTTEYSADGLTKTVTEVVTTKKTEESEVNLKRLMSTTEETTITETDLTTGIDTVTTASDTNTQIVEPEQIGETINGLEPGEKIKIAIVIENVSAGWNEEITVHYHFAPVDCDGYFFVDEVVSTGDITVISTGRNYQ
jgi:hypothetical protein